MLRLLLTLYTVPSQGTLYLNLDRTSSFYHYNESNNTLSVV